MSRRSRPVWRLPYGSPMDRDRLFVHTVDWLSGVARRNPPNEHELLLASGRLRMLLLDKQPLLHQVNAPRKFDVRFRIVRTGRSAYTKAVLDLKPMMWAVADGIAPAFARPGSGPIESVGLEAFLHERVMIYRGEDVTIRDLIDHLANVAGGVHAGKARDPHNLALNQMSDEIMLGGLDSPIWCLRGVAAVVVDALTPLRDAIAGGS